MSSSVPIAAVGIGAAAVAAYALYKLHERSAASAAPDHSTQPIVSIAPQSIQKLASMSAADMTVKNLPPKDKGFVGVCIAGTGRIAEVHVRAILGNRRARLVHVVDVMGDRAKAFGAKYGCPTFSTDIAQACQDPAVDAVMVCTPTQFHAAVCKVAAEYGKPIFCEKPVCALTDDLIKVYKHAASCDVPLLCGFHRSYDPNFSEMMQIIDDGGLQGVSLIHSTSRDHPLPSFEFLKKGGGELLYDFTVHDFDQLLWLTGDGKVMPSAVFACVSTNLEELRGSGVDDTCVVIVKFENGAIGHIDNSRYAPYGYDARCEVFGRGGSMVLNNPSTSAVVMQAGRDGARGGVVDESFPQRYAQAYANQMDHFLDICMFGNKERVSFRHSLIVNLLADAGVESKKTGQFVDFKKFALPKLKQAGFNW